MWTEFGSGDVSTVKLWAKLTFYDTINETFFSRFMGTGEDSIIQRLMDLEKQPGDQIKYDLLYNMKTYGVDGDLVLKGFEESLRYAQDSVSIDQKRIGHRFARMSQQRTVHDLRSDGRRKLSERYSVILDKFMASYLTGTTGDDTALAAALPFGGNALQAPDVGHVLTTGADFSVNDIETLIEMARTMEQRGQPNIRPARVNGEEKFILLLHPYQVSAMRLNTSANQWRDITKFAQERGDSNPLYSGALGEWNGVILHMWHRLPFSATGPVCHGVFMGAQAAVVAFGNAYDKLDQARVGRDNFMSWWEDNAEDYGNQKGLAVGTIVGIKKSRFTDPDDAGAVARDFGVIRLTTTDEKQPGYT